ncbi:hypothetical protein [Nostoc sp.]
MISLFGVAPGQQFLNAHPMAAPAVRGASRREGCQGIAMKNSLIVLYLYY